MNNFNIENNRIYYNNRNIDSVEHFLSLLNDIIFNKNNDGIIRRNDVILFRNYENKRIVLKVDALLDFLRYQSHKDLGSKCDINLNDINSLYKDVNSLVTYKILIGLNPNIDLMREKSKVVIYEFALQNQLNGLVVENLIEHLPYVDILYLLEFYVIAKKLDKPFSKIFEFLKKKNYWMALRELGVSYLPSSTKVDTRDKIWSNLKAGYNFSVIKAYLDIPGVKCGSKLEKFSQEKRDLSEITKYFMNNKLGNKI